MNAILNAVRRAVSAIRSRKVLQTVVKIGKSVFRVVLTTTAFVAVEETVRRTAYRVSDAISNSDSRAEAIAKGKDTIRRVKTKAGRPPRIGNPLRFAADTALAALGTLGLVVAGPVWLVVRPVTSLVQWVLGLPIRSSINRAVMYGKETPEWVNFIGWIFVVVAYPFHMLDMAATGLLKLCFKPMDTWDRRYQVKSVKTFWHEPLATPAGVAVKPVVLTEENVASEMGNLAEEINTEAQNDAPKGLKIVSDEEMTAPIFAASEAFRNEMKAMMLLGLQRVQSDIERQREANEVRESLDAIVEEVMAEREFPAHLKRKDTGVLFKDIELDISIDRLQNNPRGEGRKVAEILVKANPILPGTYRKELRALLIEQGATPRQIDQFFAGFNRGRKIK